MEHMSEDDLIQMALGEAPTPPAAAEHVRTCTVCARELDSLRHVILAIKEPGLDESELTQPPAEVWESIAAELQLGPLPSDAPVLGTSAEDVTGAAPATEPPSRVGQNDRLQSRSDAQGRADDSAHTASTGASDASARSGLTAAESDERPRGTGDRRPRGLRGRRLSRLSVALAACAALLGAAAGSAVTWWATHDDQTVATRPDDGARLDSLRPQSAGYAQVSGKDGHRTLDITVKGLPRTAGYFEVWLMDRDHKKLISMGVLGPDGHAVLPVPSNVNLSEYAVVDVSVQPYNGKPDHSGDSIVRGPYAS